jgi:hypothetical protein
MSCPDAYREALTRQAAEVGRQGVAGRPLHRPTHSGQDDPESPGAAAAAVSSGPAMALAEDATVAHSEVIDQR